MIKSHTLFSLPLSRFCSTIFLLYSSNFSLECNLVKLLTTSLLTATSICSNTLCLHNHELLSAAIDIADHSHTLQIAGLIDFEDNTLSQNSFFLTGYSFSVIFVSSSESNMKILEGSWTWPLDQFSFFIFSHIIHFWSHFKHHLYFMSSTFIFSAFYTPLNNKVHFWHFNLEVQ